MCKVYHVGDKMNQTRHQYQFIDQFLSVKVTNRRPSFLKFDVQDHRFVVYASKSRFVSFYTA